MAMIATMQAARQKKLKKKVDKKVSKTIGTITKLKHESESKMKVLQKRKSDFQSTESSLRKKTVASVAKLNKILERAKHEMKQQVAESSNYVKEYAHFVEKGSAEMKRGATKAKNELASMKSKGEALVTKLGKDVHSTTKSFEKKSAGMGQMKQIMSGMLG
jgi:hypothetical protein